MRINKKLLLIFLLALVLRVYRLGAYPVGFHVDEAKVAWNAYSILKTGHDDKGNGLSLYYNSFGDYRLTGIIYSAIPSILIFGRNEFAVRSVSALIGALTVFPVYYLADILIDQKKKSSTSYWASFFLSTSIWHITTSRATSEVVIGVFFALSSLYFFLKAIKFKDEKYFKYSFFLFLISFLFYHSIRALVPIFLFITILFYYKNLKKILKPTLITFLGVFLISFILIFNFRGLGRFSQTSIFSDVEIKKDIQKLQNQDLKDRQRITFFDSKFLIYFSNFIKEYSSYFSGGFFLGSDVFPLRYITPNIGVMSFLEVSLLVFGLILSIKNKKNSLLLVFLLVSPLIASITTEDTPNLHRAFFEFVFAIIFVSYAANYLQIKFKKVAIFLILILSLINILSFWHSYTVHAKYEISGVRNYGMKELANYLNKNSSYYDKIIITGDPDSPYPWMAFFNNYPPHEFNKIIVNRDKGDVTFRNFVFVLKRCPSDDIVRRKIYERLLLVDTGGMCGVESKIHDGINANIIYEIKRPDGTSAFTLWVHEKDLL